MKTIEPNFENRDDEVLIAIIDVILSFFLTVGCGLLTLITLLVHKSSLWVVLVFAVMTALAISYAKQSYSTLKEKTKK